jgi:hypothetical protein
LVGGGEYCRRRVARGSILQVFYLNFSPRPKSPFSLSLYVLLLKMVLLVASLRPSRCSPVLFYFCPPFWLLCCSETKITMNQPTNELRNVAHIASSRHNNASHQDVDQFAKDGRCQLRAGALHPGPAARASDDLRPDAGLLRGRVVPRGQLLRERVQEEAGRAPGQVRGRSGGCGRSVKGTRCNRSDS